MADTIKTSFELSVGLDYTDATTDKVKTIYLKVPNPNPNLTEPQIKNAVRDFVAQDVVKDPDGGAFTDTSIGTAYTTRETKIQIDIGQ